MSASIEGNANRNVLAPHGLSADAVNPDEKDHVRERKEKFTRIFSESIKLARERENDLEQTYDHIEKRVYNNNFCSMPNWREGNFHLGLGFLHALQQIRDEVNLQISSQILKYMTGCKSSTIKEFSTQFKNDFFETFEANPETVFSDAYFQKIKKMVDDIEQKNNTTTPSIVS